MSPYLMNASYFVIKVNLAYPIGSFNEAHELAALAMLRESVGS